MPSPAPGNNPAPGSSAPGSHALGNPAPGSHVPGSLAADSSAPACSSRVTSPHVAIVGATGAVGEELLRVLKQRNFPLGKLTLLASARSAGKMLRFGDQEITCEELTEESFEGVDIALFSAGGAISKKYAPIAVEAGAVVVDNSSAFRMTPGVPLVIPEVNPEAIAAAGIGLGCSPAPAPGTFKGTSKGLSRGIPGGASGGASEKASGGAGIIANPNCSTIIMLVAVNPLHQVVPVKRMVVSTYQAASGAGAAAMRELEQQTKEALQGEVTTKEVFPFQYAFNLFSHNSPMQPNGYNEEELKMVHETHKIWNQHDPATQTRITATCIRVPVMRAHAESINLTFDGTMSEDQARALLEAAPGVSLMDDRKNNRFPTPLDATNQDDCYVGRIRRDLSQPAPGSSGSRGKASGDHAGSQACVGLDLFVCGDQVRKGAALNAVQIAELLVS